MSLLMELTQKQTKEGIMKNQKLAVVEKKEMSALEKLKALEKADNAKTLILTYTSNLEGKSGLNDEQIELLKAYYDCNRTETKIIASIVNSIFTQKRAVFCLHRETLEDMFRDDKNVGGTRGFRHSTYRVVLAKLHDSGIIKTIKEARFMGLSAYELAEKTILEMLDLDIEAQKLEVLGFVNKKKESKAFGKNGDTVSKEVSTLVRKEVSTKGSKEVSKLESQDVRKCVRKEARTNESKEASPKVEPRIELPSLRFGEGSISDDLNSLNSISLSLNPSEAVDSAPAAPIPASPAAPTHLNVSISNINAPPLNATNLPATYPKAPSVEAPAPLSPIEKKQLFTRLTNEPEFWTNQEWRGICVEHIGHYYSRRTDLKFADDLLIKWSEVGFVPSAEELDQIWGWAYYFDQNNNNCKNQMAIDFNRAKFPLEAILAKKRSDGTVHPVLRNLVANMMTNNSMRT